jgi:hypothetical protein
MTTATGAMTRPRHPGLDRVLAAFLLLLLAVGSLCLWIGVPAAVLYGLSKLTSSSTQHIAYSFVAVPVAMLLFALLLFRVNALYLRVIAASRGIEEDEDGPRALRGPLELFLLVSLAIAILGMAYAISWPIAIALALVLIAFPRFPRRGW